MSDTSDATPAPAGPKGKGKSDRPERNSPEHPGILSEQDPPGTIGGDGIWRPN